MTVKDIQNTSNYIGTSYCCRYCCCYVSIVFLMVFFMIQIKAISSYTGTKIIAKVVILYKSHTAFNTFISGIIRSIGFFCCSFPPRTFLPITTTVISITHRVMLQPRKFSFQCIECIVPVSTARSNFCSISVRCLIPPLLRSNTYCRSFCGGGW